MKFHLILWVFIGTLILPGNLTAQTAAPPENTDGESSEILNNPEDYYGAGKYLEAAKLYLDKSGNKRDREADYYNAARCLHQDYIDNQSLESLSGAVEGYYRVLDLNPGHHETLINLELARIELEKHENAADQQDQKKEDQDQSRKDQQDGQGAEGQNDGQGQNDQQINLNKLAKEQQNLADSKQDEENSKKQSSLKDSTRQAREQSEQNSQTREALDQALEKQKEAMDQMSRGNEEESRQAQQEAASLLEQAAQSAAESEQSEDDSLPQDIQSILNQEQSRNQDEQDAGDMIRVEKNW